MGRDEVQTVVAFHQDRLGVADRAERNADDDGERLVRASSVWVKVAVLADFSALVHGAWPPSAPEKQATS